MRPGISHRPPQVIKPCYVELAKRFGSAQSAQFVNGILDKFLHRKDGQ
jgi:transcription termination factor NusB